jgi:hypothetical protein
VHWADVIFISAQRGAPAVQRPSFAKGQRFASGAFCGVAQRGERIRGEKICEAEQGGHLHD